MNNQLLSSGCCSIKHENHLKARTKWVPFNWFECLYCNNHCLTLDYCERKLANLLFQVLSSYGVGLNNWLDSVTHLQVLCKCRASLKTATAAANYCHCYVMFCCLSNNLNLLSTTPELFPAVGGYLYTPVLLAPGNSSGRKSRNGDATRPPLTSFLGCCRGSTGSDACKSSYLVAEGLNKAMAAALALFTTANCGKNARSSGKIAKK